MNLILKTFLLLSISINLFGEDKFPVLQRYVNDFTRTLTNDEVNYLDGNLKAFDDSTSNQLVFLMINTLDGYPIEMYTYETATKNKIGSKANNNGVLFFVAKNDRKMRIEVGYGLEGALPDALTSSIIRNNVTPYFRNNDYYSGIKAGLDAIILAAKGEYKSDSTETEEKIPLILILIIIFIVFNLIKNSKKTGGGFIYTGGGFGGFSGRSSGGFGGGGFSGGGGSFGGGGSSGSW